MFDAFARFSKSLGAPALKVSEMRKKTSASLRKAVIRAKVDAADKGRTTVLGVELRDVRYAQLCEEHGKEIEKLFATFGRMFVLGVCPEGAKLWLVGGEGDETGTVWEGNGKMGAGVGGWEEMDEFVRAFEGVAVAEVGNPLLLFCFTFPFSVYLIHGWGIKQSLTDMRHTGTMEHQTLQMVPPLLRGRSEAIRPADRRSGEEEAGNWEEGGGDEEVAQ